MKAKIKGSKNYINYIKKLKVDKITTFIMQISLLIFLLGLWEILTWIGVLDKFFFSSPSRICVTFVDILLKNNLMYHIGVTLLETIIGFAIATILGTIIAMALWWSDKLRKVMDPYIVILNSLPKIALGPIIIIWFGAGMSSIVAMCVLICIVITIISMLSAFLSCDKDKILLMKSMGASKWQILTKLVIPNARPDFMSVLKINIGMSWVGTIMGEYLVSKAGLGYLIVYGRQVFNLDLVMTSTVILCVLASLMYFIVAKIEKKFK